MAGKRNAVATIGPNELEFVEHYIRTMNAKTSYEQAFDYSGENGAQLGYKLLLRPSVQAAIEVRRQQLAAELDVTPGEVIRRMMFIGYADLAGLLDAEHKPVALQDLPRELRLALQEVKVLQTMRNVSERVEGKGENRKIIETETVMKVIGYKLAPKLPALQGLGEIIGLGKIKDNRGLEDLTLEELERLERANEAACDAIAGAQKSARDATNKVVKRITAQVMTADAPKKSKGNGKKH